MKWFTVVLVVLGVFPVGIPVVLAAQIKLLVMFRSVFDPAMIRWLWMADGAYLGALAATLIWFFARDRKSG
jgi:hypothetical protein